ncbi:hypothetical protein ACFRCI_17085 [Streptomyces sp. NPDC056638]|uniref:hypothetical protein n=1 Tax=Streptomyces sp. NPDC056638 TaxID=3345887 RepID=UPI003698F8A8
MMDSFGVPLEEGDYILSASTSGGRVKIGIAIQGKNVMLMKIDRSAWWGGVEKKPQKTGQLGTNVLVLRKADGTVPEHFQEVFSERL